MTAFCKLCFSDKMVQEKEVFICEVCEKDFKRVAYLKNHFTKTHDNKREYRMYSQRKVNKFNADMIRDEVVYSNEGELEHNLSNDKPSLKTDELMYKFNFETIEPEGTFRCKPCKKILSYNALRDPLKTHHERKMKDPFFVL